MPDTLARALETPGLPHLCDLALVCANCRARTSSPVRGISVTSDLAVLGSLHCAQCGSGRLELNDEDRAAVVAAMAKLMQSRKPLPKDPSAFFRGGGFQWNGQTWEEPRKLREELDKVAQDKAGDAPTQLRVAAGYMQIGDMGHALECCTRARTLAPDSPDTYALSAEIYYAGGDDAQAAQAAREALARKTGPNLILDGAATLTRAAITVLTATQAAANPDASRKIGRNDPCPCGSGKKYKRCCAAAA